MARTLLDLAALLRPKGLERMLQRAEELKVFDLGAIESVLARNMGHHGAARLRRAIELYRPPPFTRSGLERRFLELVGVELTRVTGRRLEREPKRVLERVARLLEQRRWQLGAPSPASGSGS